MQPEEHGPNEAERGAGSRRPVVAERNRDLERLLTFIDAIAAVAITLLVLPLVDLAGELHSTHDSVTDLLRSHGGQFWAFALSFLVIARLWLAQHQLLRPVIASNLGVQACLLLWAMAIVFLPFPTALLNDGGDQAVTKVLYIGTLAVSTFALALLAVALRRDPRLYEPGSAPSAVPSAILGVTLLVALAIALAAPAIGYFALLLLPISDPVERFGRRMFTKGDQAR